MNALLLGNLISLLGALIMVATGVLTQRKTILAAQCVQYAVMGAGNLILGGTSGTISNVLGIVRNLFCLKRELPLWAGGALVAAQAAITFAANGFTLLNCLPVVAALLFTLSINAQNGAVLKAAIMGGELCWLFYDLSLSNYSCAVLDVFTVVSNAYGIVLLMRAKAAAQ